MEEEEGGFTLNDFMAVSKVEDIIATMTGNNRKQTKKQKKKNNVLQQQQLVGVSDLSYITSNTIMDDKQEQYVRRAFEKCQNKRERKEMLKSVFATLRSCMDSSVEIDWNVHPLPELTREKLNRVFLGEESVSSMQDMQLEISDQQRKVINALVKKVKVAVVTGTLDGEQDEEQQQQQMYGGGMVGESGGAAGGWQQENEDQKYDEDDMDVERMKMQVVGVCQVLEKSYLRLTGYPKAEEVRSEETLRKSFALMKAKAVRGEENYEYYQSQYRSIRQDLHVQNIRNEFTMEVFEHNARVCLENGDVQEYGRCLGQLVWMYKERQQSSLSGMGEDPSPAYREFVYYRLIESIFANKKDELLLCLQEINVDAMLVSEELDRAMKFEHALQIGNVRGFFVLYRATRDHSRYIMDRHIRKWYEWGLKILCKAYGPVNLMMEVVQQTFGFQSMEEAIEMIEELKCVMDETKTKVLVKDTMNVLHS